MYCEIENNIIVNVVEVEVPEAARALGLFELPEGKWIGDEFEDLPEQPEEPSTESDVWNELDKAYQEGYSEGYTEGVNTAYDQ